MGETKLIKECQFENKAYSLYQIKCLLILVQFQCNLIHYQLGQKTSLTLNYFELDRCYFANHDKTMLIGADCSHIGDRCIHVTIHHCFFDGTRQRHPRLRYGKVHLYNNYTRNWGIYAVCASVEAQVLKSSVQTPPIIKFNKKAKIRLVVRGQD